MKKRIKWSKLSKEEIIEYAKVAHSDDLDHYSYNNIDIISIDNIYSKIKITCNICNKDFEQTIERHINYGRGCSSCALNKLIVSRVIKKDDLLNKLYKIDSLKNLCFKYIENMDQRDIVNNRMEINIVCKNHNQPFLFKKQINLLLRGHHCPICMKSSKKINKIIFEKRAEKVFKNNFKNFGYDKVRDDSFNNGINSKIDIYCNFHKIYFNTTANNHLNAKQGCKHCSREDLGNRLKLKVDDIIKRANELHKDKKYSYELLIAKGDQNIKNNYDKIDIICNNHETPFIFTLTISAHINSGYGCQKCAKNLPITKEFFIERSRLIHNHKYDYSEVGEINGNNTIVTIICKNHKNIYKFNQKVQYHLAGHGCAQCGYRVSSKEIEWLNQLENKLDVKIERQYYIKDLKIQVDGYDIVNNTVYEFHGDFWHGNPKVYSPKFFNKKVKCTFEELYKKTLEKESKIKEAGYNLIVMWESDFKNIKK